MINSRWCNRSWLLLSGLRSQTRNTWSSTLMISVIEYLRNTTLRLILHSSSSPISSMITKLERHTRFPIFKELGVTSTLATLRTTSWASVHCEDLNLERHTRLELVTSTLARLRSTSWASVAELGLSPIIYRLSSNKLLIWSDTRGSRSSRN